MNLEYEVLRVILSFTLSLNLYLKLGLGSKLDPNALKS